MARWLTLAVLLAAPAALACINGKFEANPYRGNPTEVQRLIAEANEDFADRRYAAALSSAEDALELMDAYLADEVDHRRAGLIAGQAALKLGRYSAAEKHLARFEHGTGATALLLARLAEARVGNRQVAKGRKALEELAQDDRMPDSQAWVALVRARKASGDEAGAAEAAREALRRDPSNQDAVAALRAEPPASSKAPVAGALGVSVAGLALVLARRRGRPLTRPGA